MRNELLSCRHLTFQSWQETIENTISSWHFRPESKLTKSFHAWNPSLTNSPLFNIWTDFNQTTCRHPWLYFRGWHGWDDLLREARPKGGVCLRPGGLQGPQGQLNQEHRDIRVRGQREEKNFWPTSVKRPEWISWWMKFCYVACVFLTKWRLIDRSPKFKFS